jgi:hypothetical protein
MQQYLCSADLSVSMNLKLQTQSPQTTMYSPLYPMANMSSHSVDIQPTSPALGCEYPLEYGGQRFSSGVPKADVVEAAISSSLPGGAPEFDAVEAPDVLAEFPLRVVTTDDSITASQQEGSISEPEGQDSQAVPMPMAPVREALTGSPAFTGNLSWGQNVEPENSESDVDDLEASTPSPLTTKDWSKKGKPTTTVTELDDEHDLEATQATVTLYPMTTAIEPATVFVTINNPPKTSRPKVQTQTAYIEDESEDDDDDDELSSPKRPSKDRKKPDDGDERVCLTETFIQEIIGPSVTKTSVMELVVVQQTSTSTAETTKGRGKDQHRLQTSGNIHKESERSNSWVIMASMGLFSVLAIIVGQWI